MQKSPRAVKADGVKKALLNNPGSLEETDLAAILRMQIAKATRGWIRRLHVDFQNDRIVVRGHTTTYYAKQLALKGIRELLPTTPVDLEIRVVPDRKEAGAP